MMHFGDTGNIVNGARVCIIIAGIGATLVALVSISMLVFSGGDIVQNLDRLYVMAGLFAGGLFLFRIAKNFSIQASIFLIPDVLAKGLEEGKSAAELESMVRTLEAHTGAAAFFNRIGFFGMSLGTVASAFLVLAIGLVAKQLGLIKDDTGFTAFMDLAKILFGAFVGSFAHGMAAGVGSSQTAAPRAQPRLPGDSVPDRRSDG